MSKALKHAVSAASGRAPSQREVAASVVHMVVAGLETGLFAPGQRLVEADLSLRSGAGRQPVRIALQELANLGVIDLAPNRGATIVRLSVEEGLKTLDVTEVLLELASRSAAARFGAGSASPRLDAAMTEVEAALAAGRAEAFAPARRRFFAAIAEAADNEELSRLIAQVRVHVLRAQFGYAALWRRHAEELLAIGRAILGGAVEDASMLSRAHVRGVRAHLMEQN